MIPIIYTSNNSDDISRLRDCTRCIVTEERNGIYECEFDYPVTGAHFQDIVLGATIGTTHDEQGDIQLFDIYAKSEPINGIVTFYAHHISYRLNEITVKPFTAGSCVEALSKIKTQSIGENPFSFWTNKAVTANYESKVPKKARSLLGGEENSILDVFGTGEYEFDNLDVKLYLHRGQDTNVSIRYGKNLIDLENNENSEDIYTAVVPYWLGSYNPETGEDEPDEPEEVLVTLPEWAINSGEESPSGRVITVPMDLSSEFNEKPSVGELRTKAQSRLSESKAWELTQNITVDFVQLWQTEEYKEFAPLQRVRLCDTVGVFVPMYNISLRAKVIRVVYNALLDRYDEMELGDKMTTFTAVFEKIYDSKVAKIYNGFQAAEIDLAAVASNAAKDATAKAKAVKEYTDQQLHALEEDLEEQIDKKIETWAKIADPAAQWVTDEEKAKHKDDLWLYTGLEDTTSRGCEIHPQGTYQYTFDQAGPLTDESAVDLTDENDAIIECNSADGWNPYSNDSDNLFDLADGKAAIYYGTPSEYYPDVDIGDYLVDSTDGSTYRWNGTGWTQVTDYAGAIAEAKTTIESEYEQAIADATEQICGGTGGYIITTLNANGQPVELLITDNIDPNQAVNVWRWNSGGLGHSHNGYDGPFDDVAITQDGKINATMITTGILTANLIKAGILSDANNNVTFNLDSGTLNITKGSINLGSGLFSVDDNGYLIAASGKVASFNIQSDGLVREARYDGDLKNVDSIGSWGYIRAGTGYDSPYYYRTAGYYTADGMMVYGDKSSSPMNIPSNWRSPSTMGSNFFSFQSFLDDNGYPYLQIRVGGAMLGSWHGTQETYPIEFFQKADFSKNVLVRGSLTVYGTKPRAVMTKDYDRRLLYCYETPTPLFGDIGEAVLDEEGLCYVDLDDVFGETIATQTEYQVFLQKEGEGDCWIADKDPRYFVIKGTPGLKVAWELKAKQRDYEAYRLDLSETWLDEYASTDDDTDFLEQYINEQEELLYG